MTRLRKMMLEELQRRNYSAVTTRNYLRVVSDFAKHFGKSPDKLGPNELRTYQAYLLTECKLTPGTVVNRVAALRFFFVKTLKRHQFREFLPYPRDRRRLPTVLSREEVARLIDAAGTLFRRTLLMTLYATGMRRSELARLKVSDIDSQRMIIRVVEGKGGIEMLVPSLPVRHVADGTVSKVARRIALLRTYIADMRIPFVVPVLLNLLFLASGPSYAADLALIGAKIYLSPKESPIENGSILIHDDQVLAVGPRPTIKIPRDATIIDCKGLVVTAGFWNSHVHILTPGLLHVHESSAAELDEQLDIMFNRWGFTTVFDISSVLDNTLALRRRIESKELRGPHILTVGEPIWTIEPVYVREFLKEHHIAIPHTETPDQAVAVVRDHAAKGADGIKLFTGSYQGGGMVAVLPLRVAKAAVEEAHRHHMSVFAHPQDAGGVNVAIESGVDVLAHTVPQSPPWTPEFVSRLKSANMALIPTLTLFDFEARKDNGSDQEREAWIAKMVAELRAYSQTDGDILFGTDIGYIDHFDTTLEFTLMSQAGMNFRQILASLTTNPAQKFGYSNRTGRIARGMEADLVVLRSDPAQDATAFSKVRYTIRSGKVIYSEK